MADDAGLVRRTTRARLRQRRVTLPVALLAGCIAAAAVAEQVYVWRDTTGAVRFSSVSDTTGLSAADIAVEDEPAVGARPGASGSDGTARSDAAPE